MEEGPEHCVSEHLGNWRTRANTGHAVLRSTSISPKMIRCNGATDRRMEGQTYS